MEHPVYITNSLTRQKENFIPLNPPHVGLYVCGPTVYGPPHLGNARPYITFDVLRKYLTYLGYKVRYVRNITDVGHLESDADEGEDKIAKKARLEQLEPMEIVKLYTDLFHLAMEQLNNDKPSIEPTASGHIIEQISMIEKIIANGLAYESNGSVYFDVTQYSKQHHYGALSGKVLDDLIAGAGEEQRVLEGQEEKRNRADFALWKKAMPEHIMRWPSPWGLGFPGWHIECSAMSSKYLGETFDIHGGGMDLQFPHHEAEIAQSQGCNHVAPVKYWMHNNMITIDGKKMGKSLGNFIHLEQFFTGNHPLLTQAYAPMTIRFFMLQAHYRSTLDISNQALEAAEKANQKVMNAFGTLHKLKPSSNNTANIPDIRKQITTALNDDLNTAIALSHVFEMVRLINAAYAGIEQLSEQTIAEFTSIYHDFVFGVLGLRNDQTGDSSDVTGLMDLIIAIRTEARNKKDFATSDKIRDALAQLNIRIKDEKNGVSWIKD
ncbi:MAG: cysteine--tRNA ligase [Bacteroidia bacterium]|nr:cysteine--tRNA ligase [Bacteroidia bacterium]HQU99579.1 cysteine--tRNA ligase [Bacteroidia bacterium]